MWKSAFRSVLLYLFLQENNFVYFYFFKFYDSHNIKVSGLTDLRVVFFSNMTEQARRNLAEQAWKPPASHLNPF